MPDVPLTEVQVDGTTYKVLHVFSPMRVLLDYEGLFALAEQLPDGTWMMSPARTDEERAVLKTFTAPLENKTEVDVFDPDGNPV